MVVHVQTERPETLDLLRRHIDMLARDLAEAGYEGASFDFGDEQKQQEEQPQGGLTTASTQADDLPLPSPAMGTEQTGLDIRI